MKQIFKNIAKVLGVVVGAYFTWAIVMTAYSFVTVSIPSHIESVNTQEYKSKEGYRYSSEPSNAAKE